MTAILGVSAFYHDSAAAIVVDGKIVAAAQEERFTRIKHDADFPSRAVEYCLQVAGISTDELKYVVFYEKPLVKFDRLLETYLAYAPLGFRSFRRAIPLWLKKKLYIRKQIRDTLRLSSDGKLLFTDHHESHAASAFFPSPFEEAAILTLDGVGEWSTATYGVGRGNKIQIDRHMPFPHSLGLLYSAFTYYCGFKVNSGEYKLMGLAPYGSPIYADAILKHLIDLRDDGSFRMNMHYFNYCQGLTMTSEKFHRLFGGPPRESEATLLPRHMDLAASIQKVTELIVERMVEAIYRQYKLKYLVLAGGVALNCVANGRILREGPFDDIWIQPAAGDAGGALGGAIFAWHQLLNRPRTAQPGDSQSGSLLGPEYSREQIRAFLEQQNIPHREYSTEDELLVDIAERLSGGKVVGWFQGRMEFGPRALGSRSILGDPRSVSMQSALNLKIKFRESFRPFAPSVMREHASEWFDLDERHESPYMLLVAGVREDRRVELSASDRNTIEMDPDLRRRVNIVRSTIPAVTHVDYSARVQTVDPIRHGRYYRLLDAFYRLTGCPVLVNTSFNVRGEPIVCTPGEAFQCFAATEMDSLVLGDFVIDKGDMTNEFAVEKRAEYLSKFRLD